MRQLLCRVALSFSVIVATASTATADIQYDIIPVGILSSWSIDDGFIEVDSLSTSLALADIGDWSVTYTAIGTQYTTTSSTGDAFLWAVDEVPLVASSTELYFDFQAIQPNNDPAGLLFNDPTLGTWVGWYLHGGRDPGSIYIQVEKGGVAQWADSIVLGDKFVIATRAVPEPSSLLMLAIGSCVAGVVRWRRKR